MTASIFFPHDECGCRKSPVVGARYRRRSRDPLTGEDRGWRHYIVTEIEPLRHDRIICRRVTLRAEDGRIVQPQIQSIFESYEAVGNVTPLPALAPHMKENDDGE